MSAALLLAVVLCTSTEAAPTPTPVRITKLSGRVVEGSAHAVTGEGISLVTRSGKDITVPRRSVEMVEVRERAWGRGMTLGSLIGGFGTAVIATQVARGTSREGEELFVGGLYGAAGAAIGAVIGTAIGAGFRHWDETTVKALRRSLSELPAPIDTIERVQIGLLLGGGFRNAPRETYDGGMYVGPNQSLGARASIGYLPAENLVIGLEFSYLRPTARLDPYETPSGIEYSSEFPRGYPMVGLFIHPSVTFGSLRPGVVFGAEVGTQEVTTGLFIGPTIDVLLTRAWSLAAEARYERLNTLEGVENSVLLFGGTRFRW